jgi:hypothetical protein
VTIDTIIRVPEVGEVGQVATFAPSGAPVGEPRFYLAYAPIDSALKTLETIEQGPAHLVGDKSPARLPINESGAAYFTPDAAGHYQVECHDVTVTKHPRTWPGAPLLPDTDNDFLGAPVVNLNTSEALSRYAGHVDFRVADTLTRTIGQAPNTLTVKLRVDESIETKFPDAVVLTPSSSQSAKAAALDDSILGIRDLLRERLVRANSHDVTSKGRLQQNFLNLEAYRQEWNAHLGSASTWVVHLADDTTNGVSSTKVTTLADALTRLADLRAAYEAHRVSATFHVNPDTSNAFPAALADPVDLLTGVSFARLFFQIMVWGGGDMSDPVQNDAFTQYSGHFVGALAHANPGDPFGNLSFDFSTSLPGLLRATNKLTSLYNAHRIRETQAAPHVSADADNVFSKPVWDGMNVADLAAWANEWARSIERHSADLDATGTPFGTAKHQNTRAMKVAPFQASDLASAIALIERCAIAVELHLLDGGDDIPAAPLTAPAHASPALGFHNRAGNHPVMTRLQLHWDRAVSPFAPPAPAHKNAEFSELVSLGWK